MSTYQITESDVLYARKLATKFYREFSSYGVDYDDLRAAAYLGLCEAARRFNPAIGERFSSFAFIRVRGAMLDTLRKARRLAPAVEFKNTTGKNVIISERLGVKRHQLNHERGSFELSYANAKSPEEECHNKQLSEAAKRFVGKLPLIEQRVLALRYDDDKSFEEIGALMGGRSKAWVSGKHRKALDSLQSSFGAMLNPVALPLAA